MSTIFVHKDLTTLRYCIEIKYNVMSYQALNLAIQIRLLGTFAPKTPPKIFASQFHTGLDKYVIKEYN